MRIRLIIFTLILTLITLGCTSKKIVDDENNYRIISKYQNYTRVVYYKKIEVVKDKHFFDDINHPPLTDDMLETKFFIKKVEYFEKDKENELSLKMRRTFEYGMEGKYQFEDRFVSFDPHYGIPEFIFPDDIDYTNMEIKIK